MKKYQHKMRMLVAFFAMVVCFVSNPSYATESVTYYHTDGLGSPVAGTDEAGALLWKEDYKPYGERIRKQVESDTNTRWFTGHPEDKETGFIYAGARHYDPVVGRFLAVDSVGFTEDNPQMFNRYAYANNNPYKYVDPDGRAVQSIFGGLGNILIIGGAITYLNTTPQQRKILGDGFSRFVDGLLRNENSSGDGSTKSDRKPGADGKSGSTGGPGAGKRFKPESPEVKADKEGVPCRYCGQGTTNRPGHPSSRERDHIDPKSRGGNNSPENEGDSCRTCNRSKGAKNPDEWTPSS